MTLIDAATEAECCSLRAESETTFARGASPPCPG
jgi:hypothetical protein